MEIKNVIQYKAKCILVNGEEIKLSDIIDRCNSASVTDENKVLVHMSWPSSRNFDGIDESIVMPKQNALRMKEIISGKTIYFGEINGKHSDIYGELEPEEINIIEDQEQVVNFLKDNPSGHDYDYSFIHTFNDYANDGGYDSDEVSEELAKEFDSLF